MKLLGLFPVHGHDVELAVLLDWGADLPPVDVEPHRDGDVVDGRLVRPAHDRLPDALLPEKGGRGLAEQVEVVLTAGGQLFDLLERHAAVPDGEVGELAGEGGGGGGRVGLAEHDEGEVVDGRGHVGG